MASGKPISQWLKRNLVASGKCSTASSVTNSQSDSSPESRSTVIDGLLSIDTSSSFDENDQPQSVVMVIPPTSYNNLSPNRSISQKYKSFDHLNLSTIKEDYRTKNPYVSSNSAFKKLRERQFGSRSSLKRLSRYKMRPSLFSAYPNSECKLDSTRSRDRTTTATPSPPLKLVTGKSQSKHIRIGLFYTWSFAGQRQRKVVTIGENELGRNPKLDKLWEEAAKALNYTTEREDEDLKLKEKEHLSSRNLYESPKELESEIAEMDQKWTAKATKYAPQEQKEKSVHPTFYERYPDGSNKSMYRNIYPYTTFRGQSNAAPAVNRRNPQYGSYQCNFRTLPVSKRKLFRADLSKNELQDVDAGNGKNVETIHKNFYDMMTGANAANRDYRGYYSNSMVPVGPVLITPLSAQPSNMGMPTYPSKMQQVTPDRRWRFSGRNCIFAWALGLTAALILALAIALFVQINRDNTEYKNLQEQLASSASDLMPTQSTPYVGGFAAEVNHPKKLH